MNPMWTNGEPALAPRCGHQGGVPMARRLFFHLWCGAAPAGVTTPCAPTSAAASAVTTSCLLHCWSIFPEAAVAVFSAHLCSTVLTQAFASSDVLG